MYIYVCMYVYCIVILYGIVYVCMYTYIVCKLYIYVMYVYI